MKRAPLPRRAGRWLALACLLSGAGVPAAHAHLVTTGLGPVYDGIGHFLLTPEDILPVIALGLLAGLRGAETGRWCLWCLPTAWLVGGLIGAGVPASAEFTWAAVSFLALGILVAADVPFPSWTIAGFALVLGLVHGFFNGEALRAGGTAGRGLIGIAATIFVLSALVPAGVLGLRAPAARIGVRILGSWIAAVGLLVLGWTLHAKQG